MEYNTENLIKRIEKLEELNKKLSMEKLLTSDVIKHIINKLNLMTTEIQELKER